MPAALRVQSAVRSVGHGGVNQHGTFLSVEKEFYSHGQTSKGKQKLGLGRFMAAFGRLVPGAWPGWHSSKVGDG